MSIVLNEDNPLATWQFYLLSLSCMFTSKMWQLQLHAENQKKVGIRAVMSIVLNENDNPLAKWQFS